MFSSSKKPFSSVTVEINRLTGPEFEEDDYGGLVDLIEAIRLQATGSQEAARAIRKKLKYGNPHAQLRALTILDGLMQNAGPSFQRSFADAPLLERLRWLPCDDVVDAAVRTKCRVLYTQWANTYRNTPGMLEIVNLHRDLPKLKKKKEPSQYNVIRETERQALENPFEDETESPTHERRKPSISRQAPVTFSPTASSSTMPTIPSFTSHSNANSNSKKDKKQRHKPLNVDKERTNIMQTISSALVASTNLMNALKLINRERELPSQNRDIVNRFETCKALRRQVLRYIHAIEGNEIIGSLLDANDKLIEALIQFEVMDKGIEDDSDSDMETANGEGSASRRSRGASLSQQLGGMKVNETPPAKTPGQTLTPQAKQQVQEESEPDDEDDEDNPFGDHNAI